MSKMSELYNTIHEMWVSGVDIEEIGRVLNLPENFVDTAFDKDVLEEESEEEYDDSMDGDFDSAMESCGWGYDEQYNGWVENDEY